MRRGPARRNPGYTVAGIPVILWVGGDHRMPFRGTIERQVFGGPRALFLVRFPKPISMDGIEKALDRGSATRADHRMWLQIFKGAREAGLTGIGMTLTGMWARWQDISLDLNRAKRGQRVEVALIGGAHRGAGKVPVYTGRYVARTTYAARADWGEGFTYVLRGRRGITLVELDEPTLFMEVWGHVQAMLSRDESPDTVFPRTAIRRGYLLPSIHTISHSFWKELVDSRTGEVPDHIAGRIGRGMWTGKLIIERLKRVKKLAAILLHYFKPYAKPVSIGGFQFHRLDPPIPMRDFRKALRIWKKATFPGYRANFVAREMWRELIYSAHLFILPLDDRELFGDPMVARVAIRPMREDLAEYLELEAAEAARGVR